MRIGEQGNEPRPFKSGPCLFGENAMSSTYDLSNMFEPSEFCKFELQRHLVFLIRPNEIYLRPTTRTAVLVVRRSSGGDQFPLGKNGLNKLIQREDDGTIGRGYVVLIERNEYGNKNERIYVDQYTTKEAVKLVKGLRWKKGNDGLGDYIYINSKRQQEERRMAL